MDIQFIEVVSACSVAYIVNLNPRVHHTYIYTTCSSSHSSEVVSKNINLINRKVRTVKYRQGVRPSTRQNKIKYRFVQTVIELF